MLRQELEYHSDRCEHRGRRSVQQDSSFFGWMASVPTGRKCGLLAVVADGMGGHAAGEIASSIVVKAFTSSFEAWHDGEPAPFERSMTESTRALSARVLADPKAEGMGSTVVAAYFDQSGLSWISVGDSSLLRFRGGRLERLNANHSYGAHLDSLARDGRISHAEAEQNPRRHALMSALNGETPGLCDLQAEPIPLAADDWIILASDGLDTLPAQDVEKIAAAHANGRPIELASALIDAVHARNTPDQDNVSIIAIKVAASRPADAGERRNIVSGSNDQQRLIPDLASIEPLRFARWSLLIFGAGVFLFIVAVMMSVSSGGP